MSPWRMPPCAAGEEGEAGEAAYGQRPDAVPNQVPSPGATAARTLVVRHLLLQGPAGRWEPFHLQGVASRDLTPTAGDRLWCEGLT